MFAASAFAELHGRLPVTPGGTDFQAYYDDVTDVTWLKDMNIPRTLTGSHLWWEDTFDFGNSLTVGGLTGWRLPNLDRNGDGTYVRCGPVFPDVTLEECLDNELEALIVLNGFWANGVVDTNGDGRIQPGEIQGDMGPFENPPPSFRYWGLNEGDTDQFGNLYGMFYRVPQVDPDAAPSSYVSTINRLLSRTNNIGSWYVRSGDVVEEICDNGVDDDGDGLVDGDDPDCQEICDNSMDDDGDGLVDEEDPDCAKVLVRCDHWPIYVPPEGAPVTIRARTIGETGLELEADEIEIWLGTDTQDPQLVVTDSTMAELNIEPGDDFSYSCLARNGATEHFSGWRTVNVGAYDFPAVPVRISGPLYEKIDVVFFADMDEYTSFSDPAFVDDVGLLVAEGFGSMPWFVEFQHYFNFWIGTASDANSGPVPNFMGTGQPPCLREAPEDFGALWTFSDASGIVHRSVCRDNAGTQGGLGLFTIEVRLERLQVLVHEAAHRPFGLLDEYCCDGGYRTNEPFANLFPIEADCQVQAVARGFPPEDCRDIVGIDERGTWWIFEPNFRAINPNQPEDLMQQSGCASFSDDNRCMARLEADVVGVEADPNGIYACDQLMSTYRGDPDGTPHNSDDRYWFCRAVGTASNAVWQQTGGTLDRYAVGASELDRLFWFLSACDGGNC